MIYSIFPVPNDFILDSEKEANSLGILNKSILKGRGNKAGLLMERVVCWKAKLAHKPTFNYDCLLPNKKTVDVKTKQTTVWPELNYRCSVCAANPNQECDYYIFTRVEVPHFRQGWILGFLSKEEFFAKATIATGEDIDPEASPSQGAWKFKWSCYNVYIRDLRDISELGIKI